MQNKENVLVKESLTENPQSEGNKIEIQVEHFAVAKPKFTKEAWDSGEGGGEGEG